jgi:hypothetical protein
MNELIEILIRRLKTINKQIVETIWRVNQKYNFIDNKQ